MRKHLLSLLCALWFIGNLTAQTPALQISHLSGDFYVYTTYHMLDDGLYPANGLYVLTNQGAIMIDSPWDTTQFQPLLDSIEARHHQKVVLCIATHSHEDRTAGLEYYRSKGIKTYTSAQTDAICKEKKHKRPEFVFYRDTVFSVGQHTLQACYPGPGHTVDNIVVWFDREKILYGGCFIKSTEADNPGYIGEADLKAWPSSIRYVQKKFQKPRYIIPGHQDWRSRKSLEHTLKLLRKHARSK